jgi:DNA-binding response OmpR family regulator
VGYSSGPDVLLIIPDRRLRAFILAQLTEEGYRVVAVPTVRHGRFLLQRGEAPRLVVLDLAGLKEPDEAVIQLLSGIQARVLAAVGILERERAQRLGIGETIVRPFTIARLVEHIRALIGPPGSGRG